MIDWLSNWLADWQQLHTIRLLLFVGKWKGKFLLESFFLNCFNFHSTFFYFIYIYLFLLLKVCLWIWVTQLHLFRLIWTQIRLNTIIPIQKQKMGGQAVGGLPASLTKLDKHTLKILLWVIRHKIVVFIITPILVSSVGHGFVVVKKNNHCMFNDFYGL